MGLGPSLCFAIIDALAVYTQGICDVTARPLLPELERQLEMLFSPSWLGPPIVWFSVGFLGPALLWAWSGERVALIFWALLVCLTFVGFFQPGNWAFDIDCDHFWPILVLAQPVGVILTVGVLAVLLWQRRHNA